MSFNLGDYNDVASRLVEFRTKHPEGSLQPVDPMHPFEVVTVGDKVFIVYKAAAYRTPDDPRPGIGTAWEPFPGRTPYTRDSEVMVAETSAWGRAILAALAADARKGVASAEEVANRRPSNTTSADLRSEPRRMTQPMQRKMHALLSKAGLTTREQRLAHCSSATGRELASSNDLTYEEAGQIIEGLELILSEKHEETP